MAPLFDEPYPRYSESKTPATQVKGVHQKYLGTVTPPLRALLEKLAKEHLHTLSIEFVESKGSSLSSPEIKATVYSKDPKKIEWVEWMLRKAHEESAPHVPKLNEILRKSGEPQVGPSAQT